MTVKTEISLTDSLDAWAREMIAQGRAEDLSALVQAGLDELRAQRDEEDDIARLRALLEERARGPFVSMEDSRAQVDGILAEARARLGL